MCPWWPWWWPGPPPSWPGGQSGTPAAGPSQPAAVAGPPPDPVRRERCLHLRPSRMPPIPNSTAPPRATATALPSSISDLPRWALRPSPTGGGTGTHGPTFDSEHNHGQPGAAGGRVGPDRPGAPPVVGFRTHVTHDYAYGTAETGRSTGAET